MTRIYAKAIEKTDNYVEFVLFEQGQYSRPMAIINDYDARVLLDPMIDNLPTHRLQSIVELIELELLRRKSTETQAKPGQEN